MAYTAATRPWKSIDAARREFLRAGRNEEILESVLGYTSATNRVFDALEFDGRPARNFAEAFAACASGRSVGGTRRKLVDGTERVSRVSRVVRCWAEFDLTALRELAPEFAGLDLPEDVYEAQVDAAERSWVEGMAELDGYADEAQAAWYEYGGLEADEADGWDEGLIEAVLALTGEQTVTEDMIEAESAAPLVCLAGGRPSGRCSEAFADRMLAAVREAPEVDAREREIFGIEFEPLRPALPAWAWR